MSLLLCLLALLGLVRPAAADEYRLISLADGRVLQAEIVATTAQGLSLRIPQGRMDVPFAAVRNLQPLDAVAFQGQPGWRVLVLPFSGTDKAAAEEARAAVQDALGHLPAVTVGSLDSLASTGANVDALRACGQNLDCASSAAGAAGFTAVVEGSLTPNGGDGPNKLAVSGIFVGATDSIHSESALVTGPAADHPVDVLKAAAAALQIRPEDAVVATLPARLDVPISGSPWGAGSSPWVATGPTPAPAPQTAKAAAPASAPANAAPSSTAAPSIDHLRALVWVPLPGAPSLARKDWAGVAKSWAVAVPCSVVMVYGAGRAAFTAPQIVGISALSVYGLTVAVNSAFGLHGATAVAVPTVGGAAVSVAVPLGRKP